MGVPTPFIKLENLTNYLKGAQIYAKVVSEANGGAHKGYNATIHCLIAKRQGKNMLLVIQVQAMQAKCFLWQEFGLRCKIFMGAKDIKIKT